MALVAKGDNKTKFDPVEAGSHAAICYSIIDLGEHYSEMYGNSSRKVMFTWEIPAEEVEIDGEMKPKAISAEYTLSLGEKAKLRKILEGWRGKSFTNEELEGFELKNVLGAPCMLSVIHQSSARTGNTYARVSSVSRLPKGMVVPEKSFNDHILFDLDATDAFQKMQELPEWIRKKIEDSTTYTEMVAPNSETTKVNGDDFAVIDESEDLPF